MTGRKTIARLKPLDIGAQAPLFEIRQSGGSNTLSNSETIDVEKLVGSGKQISNDYCIAFLRHTGCPFAEQTLKALLAEYRKQYASTTQRSVAHDNPDDTAAIQLIFVCHGNQSTAIEWLEKIIGVEQINQIPGVLVVLDGNQTLYHAYGLGRSSFKHFAGISSLAGVMTLWPKGVRNRSASGTRWQQAGTFWVKQGIITQRHIPLTANKLPVLNLHQN